MYRRYWPIGLLCLFLWGLFFAGFFAGHASAHQSMLSGDGIRTWSHNDHANDPAVGQAACVSNQHGITKCITHLNRTYKFRSPYPQVPVNQVFAPLDSYLDEVNQWWWTKTAAGICVYDWRTYMPPVPGRVDFHQVACISKDDTTFTHPFDVGPVDLNPPADFIRQQTAAL